MEGSWTQPMTTRSTRACIPQGRLTSHVSCESSTSISMVARAGGWSTGNSTKRKSGPICLIWKVCPSRHNRMRTRAEWAPRELGRVIMAGIEGVACPHAGPESVEGPFAGRSNLSVHPGFLASGCVAVVSLFSDTLREWVGQIRSQAVTHFLPGCFCLGHAAGTRQNKPPGRTRFSPENFVRLARGPRRHGRSESRKQGRGGRTRGASPHRWRRRVRTVRFVACSVEARKYGRRSCLPPRLMACSQAPCAACEL